MALVGVIAVFGPPLQWASSIMDISPFTHVPKLPGGQFSWQPVVWLSGVALMISAVGLIALRRRDVGDLGPSLAVRAVRDRFLAYARDDYGPARQVPRHDTAEPPT
jgi:hypothetical protein